MTRCGTFDLSDVQNEDFTAKPCTWNEKWAKPERTLWTCEALHSMRGMDGRRPVTDPSEAVLTSSLMKLTPTLMFGVEDGERHAPCFDLDFPVRLVPSSTAGHFHLYFDVGMKWVDYQKLIETMRDVGLLQTRFADASIERRQTMLIMPGMTKADIRAKGVKFLVDSGGHTVEVDETGAAVHPYQHDDHDSDNVDPMPWDKPADRQPDDDRLDDTNDDLEHPSGYPF